MSQKINSLQLLRAIAVSLVIFVHASYFGVPKLSPSNPVDLYYHLKTWGNIGVDLFFAISGFIMTIIYPGYLKPGGIKTFFMKRIIRIIPLYYLLSCLDAFVTLYIHHQSLDLQVIIKTLIFFPVFDTPRFVIPMISVGWSLSYEIYFYALIGTALLFKTKVIEKLLVIILVLSTIGFLWNPNNTLLKFLTSPMLLEFAFGMICGIIYSRFIVSNILQSKKQIIAILLTIIGIVLMSSTLFCGVNSEINNPNVIENDNILALYRTIVWGVPSAIFLLGVILVEQSYRLKIASILILSGDASYSCYLIHGMIYPAAATLFKHLSLGPISYLILVIPMCIGVSLIFYRLVEMPLVLGIDKLLKYKRPITMTI